MKREQIEQALQARQKQRQARIKNMAQKAPQVPFATITANPENGTPANPNGIGVASNLQPLDCIRILSDAMCIIASSMAKPAGTNGTPQRVSQSGLVMPDGMTPAPIDEAPVEEGSTWKCPKCGMVDAEPPSAKARGIVGHMRCMKCKCDMQRLSDLPSSLNGIPITVDENMPSLSPDDVKLGKPGSPG